MLILIFYWLFIIVVAGGNYARFACDSFAPNDSESP